MAKLNHSTTWNGTVEQTTQSTTYIFSTAKKYVDKDLSLNITIPGIKLKKGQTFYIESIEGTGPKFVWTCDAVTGEITVTGA